MSRILQIRGVNHGLENEVRVEISICLDFLGRTEEAEAERIAVTDGLDDRPDAFFGWRAQGKVLEKQHRYGEAVEAHKRAAGVALPIENK